MNEVHSGRENDTGKHTPGAQANSSWSPGSHALESVFTVMLYPMLKKTLNDHQGDTDASRSWFYR